MKSETLLEIMVGHPFAGSGLNRVLEKLHDSTRLRVLTLLAFIDTILKVFEFGIIYSWKRNARR
jgi:hypothetical protein